MINKSKQIIDFLHFSEKLKNELRNGYTSSEKKESVAEHSWRVALFVMLCVPYLDIKVSVEKALKMAIVHDLVEAISGDVPYFVYEYSEKKKKEVNAQECSAILTIKKMLPPELGREIYDLWNDYEKNLSIEAKLVKALDKMEAQIQHNEMHFSHWNEYDLTYALDGLDQYCKFNEFVKLLKENVQNESRHKIAKGMV